MIKAKVVWHFCSIIFVMGILLSFGSRSAYGTYAEFTFDIPQGSSELFLPLGFEENGILMSAYSDSTYWRQTDEFTFIGLSGGVLTNGIRLAPYPGETLFLNFSTGMTNFSANFAIVSLFPAAKYLELVAYSGISEGGSTEMTGLDNGLIEIALSTPFDRVELISSDMVDFAVDNVHISNVPLPSGLFLLSSGIALLLLPLRMKRTNGGTNLTNQWVNLSGYK